jgi:hypothetical protein
MASWTGRKAAGSCIRRELKDERRPPRRPSQPGRAPQPISLARPRRPCVANASLPSHDCNQRKPMHYSTSCRLRHAAIAADGRGPRPDAPAASFWGTRQPTTAGWAGDGEHSELAQAQAVCCAAHACLDAPRTANNKYYIDL